MEPEVADVDEGGVRWHIFLKWGLVQRGVGG